jgi:hypothetical protein
MNGDLIDKIPVHIHHYDTDQPSQLRLISNQEIQSLEEQIKLLKKKKTKLKSEKTAQLRYQEKNYLEKIESLQKNNSEILSKELQALDQLKTQETEEESKLLKELQILEEQNYKEIKMREEKFEKSLKEESRRYYNIREDLDELRLRFDNELSLIVSGHQEKMQKLSDRYSSKIAQVQNSYTSLLEVMRKDSNLYETHLTKLEEEHEKEVQQVREKKNIELKKEKDKTEEYNKIQTNQKKLKTELKEEKAKEEKEVADLETIHSTLVSEVENLRNKLNKTEEQIKERDDVISRKENTIKELKAFNIHLINFHFVLNQKISTLKEERDPLDKKIREKEICIRDMHTELVDEYNKKNNLKEKSGKLRDKNKAVEELNKTLRNQIFQNQRKMNLFQSDLAQMIRTTSKDNFVQALKDLYDKQLKRATMDEVDTNPGNRDTDPTDTLIEASFQKSQKEISKYHLSVKERLESIQKQNKQYQKEKTQAIFKKQHENAFLISACNELRNDRQKLLKIISKLTEEVKELTNLIPNNTNTHHQPKMMSSSSVPIFTELPNTTPSQSYLGPIEKKTPAGKLQSIVTQLDKNRDKLAQQTIDFKKLEQKMNYLIEDQRD